MRKMISWLRQGGVLGIFPAGTVSSFSLAHKKGDGRPLEREYRRHYPHDESDGGARIFPGAQQPAVPGHFLINRKARVAFLPP